MESEQGKTPSASHAETSNDHELIRKLVESPQIQNLGKEQQEAIVEAFKTSSSFILHQVEQKITHTSVPDAEELKQIEKIEPGYGKKYLDQILDSLKEEAEHRRKLERDAFEHDCTLNAAALESDRQSARALDRRSAWGQVLAFVLVLFIILSGSYLIHTGHDWAGATIITGTIVSVAAVFLKGQSDTLLLGKSEKMKEKEDS